MAGSSEEESDDSSLRLENNDVAGRNFIYHEELGFSDFSEGDPETGSDSSDSGEESATDDFSKRVPLPNARHRTVSDQPPPSEWIEFNLKVISMRPLFKSAKVQFANKLTKQIKVLKNRKGNELQIEKCRRKAERLVEEISYVNRLKKDIIAKFALLHSKEEIAKIINDPESSMEYRVKAKVAAMPKIAKAADDYHQKHPDWRETLIKLIPLAGLKMKKKRRKMVNRDKPPRKKKKKKKKELAQPKIKAEDDGTGRFDGSNFPEPPPGLENLVANTDSSDQGSSCDENEWNPPEVRFGDSSEDDASSEETLNLRTTAWKVESAKRRDSMPDCSKAEQNRVERPSGEMPQSKSKSSVTKSQKTMKRKRNMEDSEKKMSTTVPAKNLAIKNQKSKAFERNSDVEHSESDVEEPSEAEETRRKNVDPFFMTSDNKEYKTIWEVAPADSFKTRDKKKEKEPIFFFKKARTFEEVVSGKPSKRPVEPVKRKDKKPKGKPGQRALDPEKLHPSWQAKKKLNLTAVPFQGKKIVFDDD